jgi:hypothetical protein
MATFLGMWYFCVNILKITIMAKRKSTIAKAIEAENTANATPTPTAKKSASKKPAGTTLPPAPVKKTAGNRNDLSI